MGYRAAIESSEEVRGLSKRSTLNTTPMLMLVMVENYVYHGLFRVDDCFTRRTRPGGW